MYSFLKTLLTRPRVYCPFCAEAYGGPTARTRPIFLRKKRIGFYIKCETCKRTTPAAEDLDVVNNWWDDYYERYYKYLIKSDLD